MSLCAHCQGVDLFWASQQLFPVLLRTAKKLRELKTRAEVVQCVQEAQKQCGEALAGAASQPAPDYTARAAQFLNEPCLGGAPDALPRTLYFIHTRLEGLAIAAHVDREAFGIIGQLGFIPAELRLDALELSANSTPTEARRRFPQYAGFAFVRSSDAHFVADIGKTWTSLLLSEPTTREIRKALHGEDGRRVVAEDG